jgi:prepilin-type N-terminal cleavage/methylation domain-containing protein
LEHEDEFGGDQDAERGETPCRESIPKKDIDRRNAGYTLLELLVVIGILAVLLSCFTKTLCLMKSPRT